MDMLNRRTAILSMAGAAAVVALPGSDWITVACAEWNLNGRWYSEDCLLAMAEKVNRHEIRVYKCPDTEEVSLSDLCGVATAAKVEGENLRIQVRWFTGAKPEGAFLTPSGMGRVKGVDGYPGYHELTNYRFDCLQVNASSAFSRATKV